jgi:hypothetical protein
MEEGEDEEEDIGGGGIDSPPNRDTLSSLHLYHIPLSLTIAMKCPLSYMIRDTIS